MLSASWLRADQATYRSSARHPPVSHENRVEGPGQVLMITILALTCAVVWIAAIALVVLNLNLVPRLTRDRPSPSLELPSLSVVIPARNEERDIERAVRALIEQDYPALEVIVVDDQSTDRTREILETIAIGSSRLRVIDGEPPPPGWLGKPWALQQGGAAARSELILFCDADVDYAPGALRTIVPVLIERKLEGISLLPKMEMHGFWEHVLMVQLPFTAFALLPLFVSNSVQLPVLGVGGGPGNLLYRSTWQRIGMHERLRSAVVDDIALMQLIRHEGGRTGVVIASDLVSVRMYRGFFEIVRGFSKNSFHAMGGTVPKAIVAFGMTVLLNVLPFLLLVGAVASMASGEQPDTVHWLGIVAFGAIVCSRLILFRGLGYRLDNALLGHPLMTAVWLWVLGSSLWNVGVRRRLVWRGRDYDARSARFGK